MYEEANYGIKECPVCHARCFADMDVCYGCLHPFTQDDAQVISPTMVDQELSDQSALQSQNIPEPPNIGEQVDRMQTDEGHVPGSDLLFEPDPISGSNSISGLDSISGSDPASGSNSLSAQEQRIEQGSTVKQDQLSGRDLIPKQGPILERGSMPEQTPAIKEDLESELDLQVNQASDDQVITPPVHVRAQTAQGDSYEIVISVRVPGNVLS